MISRDNLNEAHRLFVTLDERRRVRETAGDYYSKVRLTADNTAGRTYSIQIDTDVALRILDSMVAETEAQIKALGVSPDEA